MQLILDNLAATIIAGTIFLMLVAVSFRSQEAEMEAYTFEALRKQQVNFIETLRRDMLSLSSLEDIVEDPVSHTFTFYAWYPGESDSMKVVYRRVPVEVRDGVQLYQIERYVGPALGGTLDLDGASMPSLTAWRIEARNGEGSPDIAGPEEAEQVYIEFRAISPFAEEQPFQPQEWSATYRPRLLQDRTL